MHRLSASFVLGYHGCDAEVADVLIRGTPFKPSQNVWDWLGAGVYFWEANPARALDFVEELQVRRKGKENAIETPAVVGAVIDLGLCLDLTTTTGVRAVQAAFASLRDMVATAGAELPANARGDDLLWRNLDCAVINHPHSVRADQGLQPLDSVRGVFTEGPPAYDGAGFREKTHVQLCICNPDCIKGVFFVPNPRGD